MEDEIWKDIPRLKGYMFSDLGRVKSLNFNKTGKEKIMSLEKTRSGYIRVRIHNKNMNLHRLVWEAFNGPIPEGMQVNHINEDKTDNRLENLSLMTCKENINYGTRTRRASLSQSKPIYQYTISGKFVKEWESAKAVQKEKGYWHGPISAVCRGKRNIAYGYRWSFK